MIKHQVGITLPPAMIELACELPLKPAEITLKGRHVYLKPLDLKRDTAKLFEMSNGSAIALGDRSIDKYDPDLLIWQYMSGGPFANVAALETFLRPQIESNNGLCFCVFDFKSDRQIGVANFMNNFPAHLKIELGNIWYSPVVQRTKANSEATYLMLKHAFAIGYRRIEWKCDSLNERSKRAALRMGFQFEGIQESHFIIKERNRDTAWFRILDHEWESVKIKLEASIG